MPPPLAIGSAPAHETAMSPPPPPSRSWTAGPAVAGQTDIPPGAAQSGNSTLAAIVTGDLAKSARRAAFHTCRRWKRRSSWNRTLQRRECDRISWHGTSASRALRQEKARHLTGLIGGMRPGHAFMLCPKLPQGLGAKVWVSLPVHEASARVRSGPPEDEPDACALPVRGRGDSRHPWRRRPIPDPRPLVGVQVPDHVTTLARRHFRRSRASPVNSCRA